MAVTPSTGPPGTIVTITGTGLGAVTTLLFGSLDAKGWKANLDGTQIVAAAPPGGTGTVDITAANAAGTSVISAADHFTYATGVAPTITSLTPSSGPAAGGTVVAIVGTNFTGAAVVEFDHGTGNPVKAALTTFNSSTSLSIIAPAMSHSDPVDVCVTTDGGASLVYETTISFGVGDFTLVPVSGFPTFDQAFGHGATTNVFGYLIRARANPTGDWERGTGHMSAATTLVRDTVLDGASGPGTHYDFPGGTHNVVCTAIEFTYSNTPPAIT